MADPVPAPALRFNILGPLEVYRDGEPCAPTAPLQRTLLALLLLHGNELLPVTRIIDALWGHRPPRSALAALQMYVSAVRRVLTPSGAGARGGMRQHPVLRTQPCGYVIRVEPGQLDLHRFRSLAADGRRRVAEGRCAEAGELFRQALAMWRGPALADLSRSDLMQRYAVRLETERLALLQERIGADLCQGRSLELVGELAELSARYPLRESFHQQLMLALYLSGSRVEALQVYQRAHRIMVDEAGVEPGPGLRAMQQMILDGSATPHPHHSAIWCPACADRPTTDCRCRVSTCQAGRRHPATVSNR
ncbi:AfsR/SARP family transcriptional regulator [Micromonospora sp. B11E3]|uniref:AfsR/SARP family transcriptional regulator n=1 Tax=Micromonospora sp. B11E3 TaxID=3153562 RepID=UPI00325C5427